MVCQICLTTRCASTMAAGTPLRGLLHGCRHTATPLLLPPRLPRNLTCPWSAIVMRDARSPTPTTNAYIFGSSLRHPPQQNITKQAIVSNTKPASLPLPNHSLKCNLANGFMKEAGNGSVLFFILLFYSQ